MSKHKPRNQNDNSFGKKQDRALSLDGCVGLPYLRVSSKRQEIEGTGLQSQEKRCKMELENLGIPFEKSFFDSYSGGGDFMNRPAMSALLAYIDAHPHKRFVVIFDDLKRFARDTEFHLKLRMAFKARGVILKCLNHNFDDSPEGKFVETVLAGANELERSQNARQVVQKQKARLENGYRAFPAVIGYDRVRNAVHGKIDMQNEKAKYVKEGLEGFASMRFVHRVDLARFLQSKGVINGKQIPEKATATVDKMLREVFYAGYIEYLPWEVDRRIGHHEPLISLEAFEINQKRLDNKVATFVRQDIREGFELRGLVNCGSCSDTKLTGAPSTSKTGDIHNYYKCPNRQCAMYGKSIKTKDVHDRFDDLIKNIKPCTEVIELAKEIFEEVWADEIRSVKSSQLHATSRKNALQSEIKSLTQRIIKTTNELVVSEYEKQLEKSAIELQELEAQGSESYDYNLTYRTSLGDVLEVLKNPYAVWQKYDIRQKRRFFSFMFDGNLTYSKSEGYRTPNYALPIRIFEEISSSNSVDVEMGVSKPRVKINSYRLYCV